MKDKIVCHIIVFTLILSNFSFKLMPLFKSIKANYNHMMKMIALIGASIINEDSEMTVQLKLPLVPKPQAPIRKTKPHKIDMNLQHKDDSEIDPDEFYVPFLNREATNVEDVYVIKEIFSEDEYLQIFFELAEHNYLGDLHPYIQQFVENKTLSLEFTVLAVYASDLIKFLHASLSEIRNVNYIISHHSKTLNAILFEGFTELVQYKGQKRAEISRSRAMRRKLVCHIIVCTLILNNFQFKMDSFLDEIKMEKIQEPLRKLVSFAAATIEVGDDGTMVKLKLPLVPKTRETIRRKNAQIIKMDLKRKGDWEEAETVKIDPDDFYLPTIDRQATEVEDVYPVEEILPKDEYGTIYSELTESDENVENIIDPDDDVLNTRNNISGASKYPLQHDVEKGNEKPKTENVDQEDLSDNEDIKDADDVYLPPINRKATKLEDVYPLEKLFSKDTYKKIDCELKDNYKKDLHPCIQSLVKKKSLSSELTVLAVCASSLIKHVNSLGREIKKATYRICPNSKTLNDILIKGFTEIVKYQNNKKYKVNVRIKSEKMKTKSVCYIMICILILNNFHFKLDLLNDALKKTACGFRFMLESVRLIGASIENSDGGTIVKLQLPSAPTQLPLKPLDRKIDLSKYDIIDPDDFYVPPINREATELENVYLVDKIFSKSKYKKIYCDLEKSDYIEDLHPYIQSIIENKSLSLQSTVLAVYASELIKFIHVPSSQIRKNDFKICHISKTLNKILMKGFTEFSEYKSGGNRKYVFRISSPDLKGKMACHVIVCVLILNNFQCELEPLSAAVKHNKNISNVQGMVRLVGASIVDGENGKLVQLKLPLAPKTQVTRRKQSTKIIARLSKRSKNS